ncbi:ATP-binding domain-containing protein [Micrococcus luteus]|nr:ATP-binding domain-containing protein [Micrococcus luteus]
MISAYAHGGDFEGAPVAHLASVARTPDAIFLSTIHSSKGLEFQHVIVTGVDNSNFPGFKPSNLEVLESRRLLYVAMTRAKSSLLLVNGSARLSRRGNSYRVYPSDFIDDEWTRR